MKQKLSLFLLMFMSLTVFAQSTGFKGNIVDQQTGLPIQNAHILIRDENNYVRSDEKGHFTLHTQKLGEHIIDFFATGYDDVEYYAMPNHGTIMDLGTIQMIAEKSDFEESFVYIDESQINDEDGSNQTIGSLSNGSDDVFLRAASFNFGTMRYRLRGYNQEYATTYINGVSFNDGERGRFNFSMLGGLNTLFRNREVVKNSETSNFGFGDIGGSTNILTRASGFAKGVNASLAATNRAYVLRGMVSAASGVLPSGWAFNGGLIYRWSKEGAWDGTFYNSFGYYLGAEKKFKNGHSLSLITFGAPTERGQQAGATQEVYDLTGSIYYNPNWGFQNGEKRNARVVNSYDPTAVLSYEWKISPTQRVQVGLGTHYNQYSSTAITFYNAPDPRPDYYRYMPSYLGNRSSMSNEEGQLYDNLVNLWQTDSSVSQINWDQLYRANHSNNLVNPNGISKYSLEQRHNDLFESTFNANYNGYFLAKLKVTAGIEAKYSKGMHYKTMNDLLGGNQWIDIDQFSERDFPSNPDIIQNDLNNPNRVIREGDRFGYDYEMNIKKASAFIQNEWNLSNFDLYYATQLTYYSFQREGNMKNGRAELFGDISYGKGKQTYFVTPAFKTGLAYKIDGRNRIYVNALLESRAPLANNAYISQRIRDAQIIGLTSEKILSYDLNYEFSYRRFKGRVSGFQTHFKDVAETNGYFDDVYKTFINQTLSGIEKKYLGVEAAVTYRINDNFATTAAGSWGDYRYVSDARSIISSENGSLEQEVGSTNLKELEEIVHTKDLFVSAGPQIAASLALNYSHRKMWFAELKASYFDKSYIDFNPSRYTASAYEKYANAITQTANNNSLSSAQKNEIIDGVRELQNQEKFQNGVMVDATVGKVIYLRNRSQSLNINMTFNNLLNNRNMKTGGYQQARIPLNSDRSINTAGLDRFPNKYFYAQGFNFYLNVGYRF